MNYKTLYEILNGLMACVEFTARVSSSSSCSDCSKSDSCEYVPAEGETNRFNCPLWEKQEESE